jgi:hypothetical protein
MMIIERHIWEIKHGGLDEAIALIKAEIAASVSSDPAFKARVMTAVFGPFNQLIMEVTFDSLSELEAFWEGWVATRGAAFAASKFDSLTTSSQSTEVWRVEDPSEGVRSGKYINRRTFITHPGRMEDVIQILVSGRGDPKTYNVLSSVWAPGQRVVMTLEFDTFDEYFKGWEEWGRTGATPEFWQLWYQVTAPGGSNEVWEIV